MRSFPRTDTESRMKCKLFDPEFIMQWNKAFLLCSVIALSLDPLFLYILTINGTKKCIDMDRTMVISVSATRSLADILYVVHIIIKFPAVYIPLYEHILGKRKLKFDLEYVANHYQAYCDFIVHVLVALPLPQVAVLVIIPNLDQSSLFLKKFFLKSILFSQFAPRLILTSLFYRKVTKVSGYLTEKAWVGAGFNFFLYVLASHVIGALWYLFAIESQLRCWRIACERHNSCRVRYLFCGEGRVGDYGFLNTSCPLLERNEIRDYSTSFDFGIYLDALQTRIVETRDFPQKILYCSWWGFQNLSSLGQGLKASTFYEEIFFADFIAAIGLVLFAFLLGNMQKYLQSYSNLTLRMEEMKEKRREAEDLMSYMSLPDEVRQRVRNHKRYKWKITRGVELDSFVKGLPWDIRKDIKRHLCLPLLKKVPMFEAMNHEHLLDAMCDHLRRVLYTQNSCLVREGDPVREMLFITIGEGLSTTKSGGNSVFFKESEVKAGDFCGEELLPWVLNEKRQELPFSTTTIEARTDIQGFALAADDLLLVASQFKIFRGSRVQHAFRFYSYHWRTWAANCIQVAWRRHYNKHEKALKEENKRLQDALATGSETSTLSLGASISVSRFSSNALRNLRRNYIYNDDVSYPLSI